MKIEFETLFADGSPKNRSVHQNTVVRLSLTSARRLAARTTKWNLKDGEEREELQE